MQVFYKPLQSDKVLTEEELNVIFINWKELRLSSMKLMKWVWCCHSAVEALTDSKAHSKAIVQLCVLQRQWTDCCWHMQCHLSSDNVYRQGCSLSLDVSVSRCNFQMSWSRLGLVETWEGLGLDLVSDWKWNVSVLSRSRTIGSRLQANMHSFLLHCKIARTSFWMQGVYIVYWFTS